MLGAMATIQDGSQVLRIRTATLAKKPLDLTRELDAMIGKLWACGYPGKAEELRSAAYAGVGSSSSEILGEIGLCILRIQRDLRRELPKEARAGLARCLKIVRKTWPDIKLPKP